MDKKVLNFGIVGAGMIADFHAKAINSLENALLLGVCDAMNEKAQRFKEKYNIKAYQSFEEMLLDEKIDAVCICTPSGFHKQNAIAALNAKKHVVLEKPMAFTLEESNEIIAAAEKNGRLITVISQLRFSKDIQRVKKLISEGAFGKIVFADLYMKYWRSENYYSQSDWKGTRRFDGGGALMNQGIHGVDILLYLMGNARVLHSKNKTSYHDIEVEDQSVAMLEFKNGALGVIEASTCAFPGFERKIEIIGSNGCAVLKENRLEKLVINGKEEEICKNTETSKTASDPSAFDYNLHSLQLSNFIGAVFNENELLIDGTEGSRAVALIEEIYKN